MQFVVLKKDQIDNFISNLAQGKKVAAPVSKGFNNFAFEYVTSGKDVVTGKYIPTILPPKKYFLPQYETILEYDKTNGQNMKAVVEYEKVVLFGVHTCDLAGIQNLDVVFFDGPKDENYLTRKENIDIIGLECLEYCDKYASCKLVGNHAPNGGYDLFFTDLGDRFIVHINTEAGDTIVKKSGIFQEATDQDQKDLADVREKKKQIFKNEVPLEYKEINELFEKSFESPVWQDLDKRCIACGNCTAVCPTCYCFDIIDEPNLDLTTGRRYRRWDSCQNETFAKVAGNENFRKTRAMRQRHRYFRKFKYQSDKYSKYHCTGCGRCSRTCMAGIVLKETLNDLIKTQVAAK